MQDHDCSHEWTHSICDKCWIKRAAERGQQFDPFRIVAEAQEVCCFCGNPHASGIFVREDPKRIALIGPN